MFKKSITAAALTLALALGTAAPVLGSRTLYTDADSGFRVKTPDPAVQFVGKDFYAYVLQTPPEHKEPSQAADDEPEITITEDTSTTCLVYAVPAAQVEAATGKKFTTKDFIKNYEDLAVMERNGIDPNKADYFLYNLDHYRTPEDDVLVEEPTVPAAGDEAGTTAEAKDGSSHLAVIPSSLLDHADISLSTGKRGKTPYVFIHLVEKLPDEEKDTSFKEDGGKNFARHDMQLALTSANDILYIITTNFELPNLNNQKDALKKEYTPLKRTKKSRELTAANTEDLNAKKNIREDFLKNITFFAPQKAAEPYGYRDPVLQQFVRLPDDWIYCQTRLDKLVDVPAQAAELGTLTLGLRGLTMPRIYDLFGQALREKNYKDPASIETALNLERHYKELPSILFSYSGPYTADQKKHISRTLHNDLRFMGLAVEAALHMGVKSPTLRQYLDVLNFKTRRIPSDQEMTIYLKGEGVGREKPDYPLLFNGRISLYKDKAGAMFLIRKNTDDLQPEWIPVLGMPGEEPDETRTGPCTPKE